MSTPHTPVLSARFRNNNANRAKNPPLPKRHELFEPDPGSLTKANFFDDEFDSAREASPINSPRHLQTPKTASYNDLRRSPGLDTPSSRLSVPTSIGHTPKTPSLSQFAKLQAENEMLRAKLLKQNTSSSVLTEANARDNVKSVLEKMILNEEFQLEQFKSLSEKLLLLDEAIKMHFGDAIIRVLVFLKSSLEESIFNKHLFARKIAVDHYQAYLEESEDIYQLTEFLNLQGRTKDVAMLEFQEAMVL